MFARLRLLALPLMLALLISACMDGPALPASSTIPLDAATATVAVAPAATDADATAAPADATIADSAAYPMTVTDDNGEVTIPARPERIVTIDEEINETLVALDIQPVGFGSSRVERGGAKETGVPYTSGYLDPAVAGAPIYVGG